MNPDYEILIQREIDGDLEPDEQATLAAAIADDPQLRQRREELLALGEDLRELAARRPGPELASRVMERIAAEPRSPVRRAAAPRRWRPDRRQILAFAAGIAVMFVAGRILPPTAGPVVDEDLATGSLVRSTGPEVDRGAIDSPDLRLQAWTERTGDLLTLHARGESGSAVPVRVAWDAPDWALISVRSEPAGSVTLEEGWARFVQDDPGPFTLDMEFRLRRGAGPSGDVRLRLGEPGREGETLDLGTAPAGPGR